MPEVHILNPLATATGGSEWRALSLFEVLADHAPVSLWALDKPAPSLYGRYPIRQPRPGMAPRKGTFVLVGVHFAYPAWLAQARMDRAIIVYNIHLPVHLRQAVQRLRELGAERIEVVCASEALRKDLDGLEVVDAGVEASWIDIVRFSHRSDPTRPRRGPSNLAGPVASCLGHGPSNLAGPDPGGIEDGSPGSEERRPRVRDAHSNSTPEGCQNYLRAHPLLRLGRLSRDVPEKFHEHDPELFLQMAEKGFELKILGGCCLASKLSHPRIELLSEGAVPPEDFLQDLDVFLYRTSDHWYESFGRTVFEAMACGVVPVAGSKGGYAEWLEHEVDSFVFETNEEAVAAIQRLESESVLFEKMSNAARAKVEQMYGEEARLRMVAFYAEDVDCGL